MSGLRFVARAPTAAAAFRSLAPSPTATTCAEDPPTLTGLHEPLLPGAVETPLFSVTGICAVEVEEPLLNTTLTPRRYWPSTQRLVGSCSVQGVWYSVAIRVEPDCDAGVRYQRTVSMEGSPPEVAVTLALIVTSPFSVAPLDGAVMQVWIVDELTFVVTHGWFWASRSSRSTTWPGAAPAGWLTRSMQPIRNNLSHAGKRCVRTAVRKRGGELMPYLTDRLLVPSHRSFGASSHSWVRIPGPGE